MTTENNIKVLEGAKDYVTWRKRIEATLIEKGWMKILEAQETASQEDKSSLLSTESKRKDNAKVCSIVYNRVSDPILERLDEIELAVDIFQTLKEWYKPDPRLEKLRLKHMLQHPAGRTLAEKIENFKVTLRRLEKLNVTIEEDDKIDGVLKVVRIKVMDTFRMIVDADRQNYSFQQVYNHLLFFAHKADVESEAKSDISSTREKGSQKQKRGLRNSTLTINSKKPARIVEKEVTYFTSAGFQGARGARRLDTGIISKFVQFIVDTGASQQIVSRTLLPYMTNVKRISKEVISGISAETVVNRVGDLKIQILEEKYIVLRKVLTMETNVENAIISVGKLLRNKYTLEAKDNILQIKDRKDNTVVVVKKGSTNLHRLHAEIFHPLERQLVLSAEKASKYP
eukprot:augustus_masked-scaffold_20-processed-gene-5.36-mRNA-1 protein AED:1.00 eAED:1.00 QI:0/0/0/0/1/1/2/0/398